MHSGHRARLKERFLKEGLSGFAAHEVLELLLTYAIPQRDVNPLAHALIKHYGSLSTVLEASAEELQRFPGIGPHAAALLSMVPQLSSFYMRDRFRDKPLLNNYAQAGKYCVTLFLGNANEAVYLLCLDAQSRLIHPALLQNGTIDESQIYPRDVVATALRYQAHAVVLTHNHPGGVILPSAADYQATHTVVEALKVINVKTIDHIIVAEGQFLSMAQHSLMRRGNLIEASEFEVRVKSLSLPRTTVMEAVNLEGYEGFTYEQDT